MFAYLNDSVRSIFCLMLNFSNGCACRGWTKSKTVASCQFPKQVAGQKYLGHPLVLFPVYQYGSRLDMEHGMLAIQSIGLIYLVTVPVDFLILNSENACGDSVT